MGTTVVINSVTDPGKGPVPAPFIFRLGLVSKKFFFGDHPSPLSQGLDDHPPSPLSEGLDPPATETY